MSTLTVDRPAEVAAAAPSLRKSRAPRGRVRRALTHVVLLVVGFAWVYPIVWTLAGSTRSNVDFLTSGGGLSFGSNFVENYTEAWSDGGFSQYFSNSVIITAATVVLTLLFTSAAGYVLARQTFPGRRGVLVAIAVTFFLPSGYTMIPIYDLITNLGLLNSLVAVIVVQVGGGLIFSTFLFVGFFRTLPGEMEEAARIDGASFNQVFYLVVLPLARPMIATVGLFTFIQSWNNFLLPLIFTLGQPELRTIPVGLYAFVGQTSTNWVALAAGSMISLLPMVVVFVVAQKYIVSAIAGAVKG